MTDDREPKSPESTLRHDGTQSVYPEPREAAPIPALDGRRTRLRVVRPDDYDFLHYLHTTPEMLVRYRLRGITPGPDQSTQVIFWQGALVQFVIERKDRSEPIGVVVAYNAEFRSRVASLAVAVAPGYETQGWALEGAFVFVDYLFEVFDLRKIYLESLEFKYRQFARGAEEVFRVEGCLRDHDFYRGRYWHLYFLAIYRADWPTVALRYLGRPSRALPVDTSGETDGSRDA